MKKLLMFAIVWASLSNSISQAGTKCFIFVQTPTGCRNPAPANSWFEDNYEGSPFNNGRCLMRAREYHQYCNKFDGATLNVFAAFNIDYTTISAQIVGGPGRINTYGLNWVLLPTK